jgi:hypothetical protein
VRHKIFAGRNLKRGNPLEEEKTHYFEDHINELVLPLFAVDKEAKWYPVGTGFVVATFGSGYALIFTASHNIHYFTRIDSKDMDAISVIPKPFQAKPKSQEVKTTDLYALVNGPTVNFMAALIRGWTLLDTDFAVALIQADPKKPEAKFPYKFAINPTPIKTGQEILAVGYPELRAQFNHTDEDYRSQRFTVDVTFRPDIRKGKVIQSYPEGFGIHRWPGFSVDFPLDSGMSGGPILDLSGDEPTVRGIVGGDMSIDPIDQKKGSAIQAFCSEIWPGIGLETPMSISVKGSEPQNFTMIKDLIKAGIIDDRGDSLKHYEQTPTEDGSLIRWVEH